MENIFRKNQNGTVLFLGRVVNFTVEEITLFLESQGMRYANRYEGEEIALVVLSSSLTPIEEQISYELYDMGVPDISLSQFEEYFTKHIKPSSLIMSLKLSNDQDRLKRLLKNEALSNDVYLKLFKLYNWGDDGIYESNSNRDITITFVKRFYRPDGFRDPAMIYSPTTIMNIAQDTKDSRVLDALLSMPNHQIKVSRGEHKRPKNIREQVAFNENISQESLKRLLSFRESNIDYFLASNRVLNSSQQSRIFNSSDSSIKMMLTHNSSLDNEIFKKLLNEDSKIIKRLLTFQPLNMERLDMIFSAKLDINLIAYIGNNPTAIDIIEPLLDLKSEEIDFRLASNNSISEKYLRELYNRYEDAIVVELCKNSSISKEMIERFYDINNRDIIEALSLNRATPKEILDELCELNSRELNRLLASNPSVSLYYLQQFQLDPTLIMILAKNETYGRSVLNGLGLN